MRSPIPSRATGEADKLLVSADRNPNSNGAKLTGISPAQMGSNLPKIADGIRNGSIKTLIVFGEDVTKHGIGADLLGKSGHADRQRYFAEQDHGTCAFSFAGLRARGEARHVHERQGPRAEIS